MLLFARKKNREKSYLPPPDGQQGLLDHVLQVPPSPFFFLRELSVDLFIYSNLDPDRKKSRFEPFLDWKLMFKEIATPIVKAK